MITKLMTKIIIILFVVLSLGLGGFFGYKAYESSQYDAQFTSINQTTGAYYFDSGKPNPNQTLINELKTITNNGSSKLQNLRPEMANVDNDGFIKFQEWFKSSNFTEYKQYTNNLIPTIKGDPGYPSGGTASWHILTSSPQKRQMAINTIQSFVSGNNLDGIEIDFEPSFTTSTTIDNNPLKPADYDNLLTFLDDLSLSLAKNNKKLNFAMPAILPTTDGTQLYSYESILNKPGLIDRLNSVTLMAYDLNYGNDYISTAPTNLLKDVLQVAKSKLTNHQDKFAFGLNTYGTCKNQTTKEVTQLQGEVIKARNGWNNFTQDPKLVDGEDLTFLSDDSVCSYPNKETIRKRILLAKSYGFNNFVVWSLSGNNWIN